MKLDIRIVQDNRGFVNAFRLTDRKTRLIGGFGEGIEFVVEFVAKPKNEPEKDDTNTSEGHPMV